MAGPDWEEADPVAGEGGDGVQPIDPHADAAQFPMDDAGPVWTDDAFTPSPGTPGEGGGEGAFGLEVDAPDAHLTDAEWGDPVTSSSDAMHPHPNPLPEYRERGQEPAAAEP